MHCICPVSYTHLDVYKRQVTHFDISQPMINKAKELAEKEAVLDRISFVNGALENLSDFKDKSFDMVISFDAPVSYTYPIRNRLSGNSYAFAANVL